MGYTEKLWFLFFEGNLLLCNGKSGSGLIPLSSEPPIPLAGRVQEFGLTSDGIPCACGVVRELPPGNSFLTMTLRNSYEILPHELYEAAGKGWEMVFWDTHTRFCSCCGQETALASPVSKKCPSCGEKFFPSITTAILALVRKENSVLLVQSHTFVGNYYGLVAGFLEPGESLEECVRREVMEETSLSIDNIAYFGSQFWPYPSGLMVGFTADYVDGEVKLQEDELRAGEFFPVDRLPELPKKLSLTRRMIDWWAEMTVN